MYQNVIQNKELSHSMLSQILVKNIKYNKCYYFKSIACPLIDHDLYRKIY